jgi:hypothetical protein
MGFRTGRAWLIVVFVALAMVACKDDGPGPAPTEPATPTQLPDASIIDPCTLRDSLEGRELVQGPAYGLDEDTRWQLCIGGAAAGSSEKYLFGTEDGGVNWKLLSMTTLGSPPPEPGAGELPNGNAAETLFFTDADSGWLGLSSPGVNLFRTEDGGVTWSEVSDLPPGLPVTEIDFTDGENGTLTTPEGGWTTTDGGDTWAQP